MTTPTDPLKPCPYCGSAAGYEPPLWVPVGARHVECQKCGARSKDFSVNAWAADAWNARVE